MTARIAASDAESFVYCPVAWQIQRTMRPQAAAKRRGLESHADLRQALEKSRRLQRDLVLRLLYAVASGLFMILADELAGLLPHVATLRILFYVFAFATAVLLWRFVRVVIALESHERVFGAALGDVETMDLPWVSEEHGLIGKPDVVLRTDNGPIPLEYKSSIAPLQPYDSHLVQLGCYALLIEAEKGSPPPRGIIQYSDRQFDIPLSDGRVRALTVETLARMRRVIAGEAAASRDHDNPAKCRGCSQRARCDERLA